MGKIIRMTESDLARLVNKVISEQTAMGAAKNAAEIGFETVKLLLRTLPTMAIVSMITAAAKGDVKTFSDLIEAHKSRLGTDYIKLKKLVTRGDLSKIASMLSNELKSAMGDSEPDHGPVG